MFDVQFFIELFEFVSTKLRFVIAYEDPWKTVYGKDIDLQEFNDLEISVDTRALASIHLKK